MIYNDFEFHRVCWTVLCLIHEVIRRSLAISSGFETDYQQDESQLASHGATPSGGLFVEGEISRNFCRT